jgi:hypothetical protein
MQKDKFSKKMQKDKKSTRCRASETQFSACRLYQAGPFITQASSQSICLVYALYLYHRINSKIVQETMIASQKSSLNAKSNTKIVTEKQNWASFHAITDNIKSEIHVMIANSRRNAQTILSQIPMLLRLWQLFSYRSRWGCQQRRQRKLIKW